MNVVICPDSFKGSCSAAQAAAAIARGVRAARPDAHLVLLPLADGGEGTLDTLCASRGALHAIAAHDPLMRPVRARWGMLANGIAVVEMAQASGLTLLEPSERNPLRATTFGTGELIAAAMAARPAKIILAIGGSATNDCGAGMAQALGYRFLDAAGAAMPEGICGGMLARVARIERPTAMQPVPFETACDVTNPLCGPCGAAAVYGPQKGATLAMASELDAALDYLAGIIERDLGVTVRDMPGAGAAGGLGAGSIAFLGSKLRSGIDLVLDAIGFDAAVRSADLVITGEGAIDAQSGMGKVLSGVVARAGKAGARVVALAGIVDGAAALPCEAFGIVNSGVAPGESMREPEKHLERLAAGTMKTLHSV